MAPASDPQRTTDSGLASPPPGGWSWQQGDAAARGATQAPAGTNPSGGVGNQGGDPFSQVGPSRERPAKPRLKWRMFVIGLVLLLLVPVALIAGALRAVVDGPGISAAVVGETGTVFLDAGGKVALYASGADIQVNRCTVTSPAGKTVALESLESELTELGVSQQALRQSTAMLPYASFTPTETGQYQVSCPGGAQGLVVGPALKLSQATKAGGLVIAAAFSGLVGLILSVIGLVRLIRSRRR